MQRSKGNINNLLLAGFAFILAGIAVAIATPDGLNGVNKQPNFIGVVELAEKIKNQEKFSLIDLRDSASYAEFHIPKAKNNSLQSLDLKTIKEPTIFYSGDDLLDRRIWDLLPDSLRTKSHILYGGIRDWYDHLLYPTLPFGDHVNDEKLFKQVHDLCQFYGGYADFKADSLLLDYYRIDLSNSKWPKVKSVSKLVRKGC
ncbi:rhodanese-like domain-containing protein [Ekhidna sp. To15]|uniref:rhodanese-like domain-containing protein n=1 Tax=Ekhidna sp. To15 TaxID=3395267 RepID=UPI003F52462D